MSYWRQMLKSVGWASLLTHKELMSGMIFFKAAIVCYTKELVSLLTGFVGLPIRWPML